MSASRICASVVPRGRQRSVRRKDSKGGKGCRLEGKTYTYTRALCICAPMFAYIASEQVVKKIVRKGVFSTNTAGICKWFVVLYVRICVCSYY